MTALSFDEARRLAAENGQEHILRFWDRLDRQAKDALLADVASIDFKLMKRLIDEWIHNEPAPERFETIDPVPLTAIAFSLLDPNTAPAPHLPATLASSIITQAAGTRFSPAGPIHIM